jgi:DNA invertase Pin-like site-specific DNA recombinase
MSEILISYLRVSTHRQGESGLGLEAQRQAVSQYASSRGAVLLQEYVEVESGKVNDRPILAQALLDCRRRHATLTIAKLDRLARSVHFIAGLMDGGVEFVAVDMPCATPLLLHVMAAFAQHEREQISTRTKAALAAARARGGRLGANGAVLAAEHKRGAMDFAESVRVPVEEAVRAGAATNVDVAGWLNDRGVLSREGGRWHATTVARLRRRLGSILPATASPQDAAAPARDGQGVLV